MVCRRWLLIGLLGAQPAWAGEATIAIATNFLPAAKRLAAEFERESGHRYRLVAGATGSLSAQILNGAPYDVLMAADVSRPLALVASGYTSHSDVKVYAHGLLALWVPDSVTPPTLEDLRHVPPSRIAMANPRVAPYGAAAVELLKNRALWQRLAAFVAQAQSVSGAQSLVASGSAAAGFVALSGLVASGVSPNQYWVCPSYSLDSLAQGMVGLTHGRNNAAAEYWMAAILSEQVQNRIVAAGYAQPDAAGGSAP